MIDDGLRPVVTEFVAGMLNDSHCKSALLDVREDARVDSDLPVLYLDVIGKRHGCTLSVVGDEYSGSVRYATGKTRTIVEGETGAWGFRKLLDDFRTRLREGS